MIYGPLGMSLRNLVIRDSEIRYLLWQHHRHADVRRHVRIVRRVHAHMRATRGGWLLAAAIILGVAWWAW